jgi:hypothetical protein
MRLSRSDAKQNGRAALICKAYAKRGLALQAASDQYFICRRENFRFRKHPKNGILLPGFGTDHSRCRFPTNPDLQWEKKTGSHLYI